MTIRPPQSTLLTGRTKSREKHAPAASIVAMRTCPATPALRGGQDPNGCQMPLYDNSATRRCVRTCVRYQLAYKLPPFYPS